MGRLFFIIIGAGFFLSLISSLPDKTGTFESQSNHAGSRPSRSGYDYDSGASSSGGGYNNASYGETRLSRGASGQFHVDARLNGQTIPFLIDTGADMVAITASDAQRLGIYVNRYEFQPVGTGAGGEVKGQYITINHMEVAGRTLSNVRAVVIDGLETNLLGQSVLRQFGKVELSGDTMIIKS